VASRSAAEQPMTVPIRARIFGSTTTHRLILGLTLAVVTVALYYPVSHYQFVSYDDGLYITDNWHIKYGLSWSGVKWAFTANYADNWHPLTWLSHGLDCQLFFLNSGRHHATNLLLHAMNAVLLYWVLLRATGYAGRSFMVAALFALHPINVESVAWVSERKNLLSMVFFLLALGAYRWYAREPRAGRYATVALLFALGLMAKPQIITLPFVLLLWDYWPLRRMFAGSQGSPSQTQVIPAKSFSWLVLEKLPLVGLAVASAVITLHAQREATTPYPFSVRLANALVSYAWYVKKAFWPSHLALLYPHPPGLPPIRQMAAASLLLLVITALVVAARRHRYLLTGWLWFLGTLVPMIGLVQVGRQAMADRYAYLSLVGLFIMVCWGVAEWSEQLHLRPVWLRVASVAALLALAVVAHRQIGYWQDSYALWSRSIQLTSPNQGAEDNLGVVLMNEGRFQEALPHLQEAVALDPQSPIYNLNLAICEHRLGNLTQALQHYQAVIRLTQNDVPHYAQRRHDAFYYMSFVYRDLGDLPHAWESQEEVRKMLSKHGD
jgi:protein O-mannosyl-transferase